MMDYLSLKYIHIMSATIMFGTGIGTAFFMLMAYCSKNIEAIKTTARTVVIADWLFTLPTVIIQPITGIMLMQVLNYSYRSFWFHASVGLYVLAGLCWIPVVFMQIKMREISKSTTSQVLPASFHRLMRYWIGFGIIAFSALILVYVLMVWKMGLT
jgi:uncharacterized membrane protein